MESGAGSVASLAMDCEDMFKEITKKLYGEETVSVTGVVAVEFPATERELDEDLRPEEHITAWGLAALMQNGFPPPGILQANFTPRTDPTAEDRWTAPEEPLAWAHSRIAAYNPAQRLFKCAHCDCVGFLARLAEHWLGTHSQARAFQCPLAGCGFASSWARGVRTHLARDHHSDPAAADQLLRDNPALDDLTRYLQRLKNKVESMRNDRRATAPEGSASENGVTPGEGGGTESGKRYACGACPYATDRRDLFTRHENIHRDEKPFHCYLCQKQFNRADHVKKHFLRMHRDQPYDLNRIRRATNKTLPQPQPQTQPQPPPQAQPQPALHYYGKPPAEPPPAPVPASASAPAEYRTLSSAVKLERAPLAKAESGTYKSSTVPPVSGTGVTPTARRKGERRFACCYCAWSGVDNWCLKRHLNTHLKPFACALCEYKAARAERLATHVHKVHNKKSCGKCPYLADDQHQLAAHLRDTHHIESRNLKVPTSTARTVVSAGGAGGGSGVTAAAASGYAAAAAAIAAQEGGGAGAAPGVRRRAAGAARLFGYLEASDGSGDEYEGGALVGEFGANGSGTVGSGGGVAGGGGGAGGAAASVQHYTRDKENAAPLHHGVHHDQCLRY